MKTSSARWRKLAALVGGATLLASAAAGDDSSSVRAEPTPVREVYDALLLRPLAFVNMVAGAGVFAVAYPVTLVTGGSEHVLQTFWEDPVDRAFERPLGEL